jgi:hypothetical protein
MPEVTPPTPPTSEYFKEDNGYLCFRVWCQATESAIWIAVDDLVNCFNGEGEYWRGIIGARAAEDWEEIRTAKKLWKDCTDPRSHYYGDYHVEMTTAAKAAQAWREWSKR